MRRRPGEEYLPECLNTTMKHGGGGIMVWGCIARNGIWRLHTIDGNVNIQHYLQILKYCQGSCRVLVSKVKEFSRTIQGLNQKFSRIFKLIDLCGYVLSYEKVNINSMNYYTVLEYVHRAT